MFKIRLTKLRRMKIARNQSGFTLVEAVISIALIGIIAAALFMGLGTASKVLLHTDARETAKNLAETQMEYIKGLPYNPAATTYNTSAITLPSGYTALPNVVYPGGTTVTVNGVTYFNPVRDNNIQLVVVTINGAGITYTLEGYKVKW
jgi:prepilin-type N-terminal cleavage/methylation domain-containing protein